MNSTLQTIENQIPELKLHYADGIIPFQAEGTYQNYPFYFRSRSGHISLSFGDPTNTANNNNLGLPFDIGTPHWYASTRVSENDNNYYTTLDTFPELFLQLLPQLTKPDYLYTFTETNPQGDNIHHHARGKTPQDALHNLLTRQPELQNINPQPHSPDPRKYTKPEPPTTPAQ